MSLNNISPEPVKWFVHKPKDQVEWSKEESDQVTLLAQADVLFLISQLFVSPTANLQIFLKKEVPDIKELLSQAQIPKSEELAETYQHIRKQAESLNVDLWVAEYNRLFEGSIICPINESGFIRRDKGAILADISGFYTAFGFKLSEHAYEKVDYLTVELEFMAMLLVMLAQTPAAQEEAARTTHNALGSFSFDHLGEWLPTFCERLTENSTIIIYQDMSILLREAWNGILTHNHFPLPESAIQNPEEEEDGSPYECDMAD